MRGGLPLCVRAFMMWQLTEDRKEKREKEKKRNISSSFCALGRRSVILSASSNGRRALSHTRDGRFFQGTQQHLTFDYNEHRVL